MNKFIYKKYTSHQAGFALMDAVVGLMISSMLCVAFLSSILQASTSTSISRDRLSASISTLEMYEVAVALSQADYDVFVSNLDTANCRSLPCHFNNNGTSWSIQSGTDTIAGRFTRSFIFKEVNRDGAGDIVTIGGTTDSDTVQLDIQIDWTTKGEVQSDSVSTYLHKLIIP